LSRARARADASENFWARQPAADDAVAEFSGIGAEIIFADEFDRKVGGGLLRARCSPGNEEKKNRNAMGEASARSASEKKAARPLPTWVGVDQLADDAGQPLTFADLADIPDEDGEGDCEGDDVIHGGENADGGDDSDVNLDDDDGGREADDGGAETGAETGGGTAERRPTSFAPVRGEPAVFDLSGVGVSLDAAASTRDETGPGGTAAAAATTRGTDAKSHTDRDAKHAGYAAFGDATLSAATAEERGSTEAEDAEDLFDDLCQGAVIAVPVNRGGLTATTTTTTETGVGSRARGDGGGDDDGDGKEGREKEADEREDDEYERNTATLLCMLREKKVSVTHAHNAGGFLPLHVACRYGRLEVVTALLLVEDADVDARTASGRTPLHFAVAALDAGVVELLLKAGADAEARDHSRLYACQVACVDTPQNRAVWHRDADLRDRTYRVLSMFPERQRRHVADFMRPFFVMRGGADYFRGDRLCSRRRKSVRFAHVPGGECEGDDEGEGEDEKEVDSRDESRKRC